MVNIRTKASVNPRSLALEKAQRYSYYAWNVVSGSVLLGLSVPHTLGVSYYIDFMRYYNKGVKEQVPKKLEERFNKTLDMLKMDETNKSRFKSFMGCSFDMFSAGTLGRFGIHIGLPANFVYDDVSDIDKSKIKLRQEPISWDTEPGEQLLNALVVPENAQLYAIAREIKLRDSYKLFIDTGLAVTGCLGTYALSSNMNRTLKLYDKPRNVRLVGYCLVALFNVSMYVMFKDLVQNLYEERIDRQLKSTDPVFAEGGKVFYTKILERNKALRTLLGKEGESLYTALGNENFMFRNKHSPLVQRKAFFEERSSMENA